MKDKVIQIIMAVVLLALLLSVFLVTGCNSKIAENAGHKSIVGNGYIALNKITVTDSATQTYTPQLFSLFLSGQYVSLLKDCTMLYYDKKSNASVLNSNAISMEESLVIQIKSGQDMSKVLEALAKLKDEKGVSNGDNSN